MRKGRAVFDGEEDKKNYVLKCEAEFEHQIDCAVQKILRAKSSRIITLAGPTCSGKTTTANKLIAEFTERGKLVHVISIDDFYLDREVLCRRAEESGQELDFDSVDTIDIDELGRVIEDIFYGGEVETPVFDFKSGKREAEKRKFFVTDNDMFVFEGIQAAYPAVTALFDKHPYVSIFISVGESLEVNGYVFSPNEIRFMRRLVRDYNFRGASPDFTYKLWESVRRNEEENILKHAKDCDIVLDSLLDYELSMLKGHLEGVLSAVKEESPYFICARELMARIEHIPEISKEYIPQISVYHEFLG